MELDVEKRRERERRMQGTWGGSQTVSLTSAYICSLSVISIDVLLSSFSCRSAITREQLSYCVYIFIRESVDCRDVTDTHISVTQTETLKNLPRTKL